MLLGEGDFPDGPFVPFVFSLAFISRAVIL